MLRIFLYCLILLDLHSLYAQSNLAFVKLDSWAKNNKDENQQNPLAFFDVSGDTILTYDFENVSDAKPVVIKKPTGYATYAYGYLYYSGVPNTKNPGLMNLLLCDYKNKTPKLYIDRNANYNFTDDGEPLLMPAPYSIRDSIFFTLPCTADEKGGISIQLNRFVLHNKTEYRNMMNEYYQSFYGNRKFIGMDYCFRETRKCTRAGIVRIANDSFRVALYDANGNGLYTDVQTDMLLIADLSDSSFDSRNEMYAYTIPEKKEELFFHKNGIQYSVVQSDAAGTYLTLASKELKNETGLMAGSKAPNLKFIDWQGKKHALRKYRKKQVYFYFTGPKAKTFSSDTAFMRKISDEFSKKAVVVAMIDFDKSYELKIFGMYSNLNWIAAFKDRYCLRDLKLRGIPSSVLLERKRRVKQYGLTPEEYYHMLKAN
jgi:hypothetical protein